MAKPPVYTKTNVWVTPAVPYRPNGVIAALLNRQDLNGTSVGAGALNTAVC